MLAWNIHQEFSREFQAGYWAEAVLPSGSPVCVEGSIVHPRLPPSLLSHLMVVIRVGLSQRHICLALSSDSPWISSLRIGRYFTLSGVAAKCVLPPQPTPWFLIQLGSLILKGQLLMLMETLSFHYVALAISENFCHCGLDKSQLWKSRCNKDFCP